MIERFDYNTSTLISSYHLLLQQFPAFDEHQFLKRLAEADNTSPIATLKSLSKGNNVDLRIRKINFKKIQTKQLPFLAETTSGTWLIIFHQDESGFLIKQVDNEHEKYTLTQLSEKMTGTVAFLKWPQEWQSSAVFSFSWFLPQIKRFKRFLPELIASSIAIQILALFIPISFQVIMDKVIGNQALSTLTIMLWILIAAATMEAILFCSRQYLAIHTANRIDASLSDKLLRHLFKLPFSYFLSRNIGVTVMRVCQLHTIRAFLASAANTLVLDCAFLIVFFAVMLLYSPIMTLLVFTAIPLCFLISFLLTPQLQQKLFELYHHSAQNTAFLTESLNSIETLKSQATEPKMQQRFEVQTRDMTLANFKVSRIVQLQSVILSLIQKLTLALVIIIGAKKVIAGELSIGQLIAFNMMAQYAFQPIIKLAELWREFIQAKVSLIQLGDIINKPTELEASQQPVECNQFEFQSVNFAFDPQQGNIINQLSLSINAGEKIAFVGESGCGKSTLINLIQKLFIPQSGHIYVNNIRLDDIDSQHLRKRIALVSQDNFLFNRSIRDNIALNYPNATIEEVITAAKLAQAHDFIVCLDDGYDTQVDEAGASLSGGQRQRIAIARALIQQADTLIFDEATSALDEPTQLALIQTLNTRQQTFIMVAHRLSTVKHCDRIFVIEQGNVIETGTHQSLLADPSSRYNALWHYQLQIEGLNNA